MTPAALQRTADVRLYRGMPPRRFPPPWSVEETDACFIVRDANGQALAYVYFEDEPGRRAAAKLLTKDEARRIAARTAHGRYFLRCGGQHPAHPRFSGDGSRTRVRFRGTPEWSKLLRLPSRTETACKRGAS